jgi:sugar/nucleoside kinase (ribokinase family)
MSLVVVGSVAYDSIEAPAGKREDILGGSATFFSLAASMFTDVKLVAVVGEDFKDEHIQLLNTHRVDTSGLERVIGGETFRWSGVYSDDYTSRTTLSTHLNVFEHFQPKLAEDYKAVPNLFLANIHPALQTDVLNQAHSLRFVACDTMNLWISIARDELLAVMKRVDLLSINDEEAYLLTGIRNIHVAAEKILQMGPKYLIIKRGEFGCALYSDGKRFLLPAYPVTNLVDPTGAGDSFGGGMMGYLSNCETIDFNTIKQAIVVGTLIASFAVECFSVDRLAFLKPDELLKRQHAFQNITGWQEGELPLVR